MREIIGAENQRNIQLNDNEVQVMFTDFTGMQRVIVVGLNETLPILPIKKGTVPVISM